MCENTLSETDNMKFKQIFQSIIIMILIICNYMILMEYSQQYNPDNFDKHKILDKKYRCIRYFHNNQYNKYTDAACGSYKATYVLFISEKILYMYMYFSYNVIMVSLLVIFQIIL
jgi:hypothetical protein